MEKTELAHKCGSWDCSCEAERANWKMGVSANNRHERRKQKALRKKGKRKDFMFIPPI